MKSTQKKREAIAPPFLILPNSASEGTDVNEDKKRGWYNMKQLSCSSPGILYLLDNLLRINFTNEYLRFDKSCYLRQLVSTDRYVKHFTKYQSSLNSINLS